MNHKEQYEKLSHQMKNVWEIMNEKEQKSCFDYAEGYKAFLDTCKTERESANEIKRMAIENGYKPVEDFIEGKEKIKKGAKIYAMNREKSIVLFHIGSEKLTEGIDIVGTHIDVPRIDLKPMPIYEDSDMVFLKTHYYGGIKKYQWTTIHLALHGVVFKKGGEKIDIVIGEDEQDPVFVITDILPHLAKDQYAKKIGEAVSGEQLNLLVGSMPLGDDKIKDKFKYHFLSLLNEKYGIEEKDFLSAEIEIVPAGKARDLGLDKSMVTAYGHDDRSCSYAGVTAMFNLKNTKRTACGMFMDKEEVGSNGNTGSASRFFEDTLAELIALQETQYSDLMLRRCIGKTQVLSGDVGAAYDPTWAGAYEKQNSSYIGKGIQLVKYTGSRGKGGCNDANAEFLSVVREVFDNNNVAWQIGELGKVDQGGGGTIAFLLANANAEVVDCGIPVLSMHAPYEVLSKADLYMAYRAYHAFLNR